MNFLSWSKNSILRIYKLLKDIFQLAKYFAKTLKAELDLTFSFEKILKFSEDMNN